MNLRIATLLCLILFSLIACSPASNQASLATEELLIPASVNGLEADLWPRYVELLNSEDCRLPCWWGFQLGQTSLDEVVAFLEEEGFSRSKSRSYYPDLPLRDYLLGGETISFDFIADEYNISETYLTFGLDDANILEFIGISMRHPSLWLPEELNPLNLESMIERFETNPSILTNSASNFLSNISLYVDYPEQGLELQYTYDFSDYPYICIRSENIQELGLGIISPSQFVPQASGRSILALEEASPFTGITAETFVQFFREHPNECLDIRDYD